MIEPKIRVYPSLILFDVVNPVLDDIHIGDIAHHLSMENRYGGATRFPYSVAAHSLYMAENLVEEPYALQALLHDAAEAYLKDMPKPVKEHLPEYKKLEDNLWPYIAERFGIEAELHPSVHVADRKALLIEQYYLQGNKNRENMEATQGNPVIFHSSWINTKEKFLAKFEELIKKNGKQRAAA